MNDRSKILEEIKTIDKVLIHLFVLVAFTLPLLKFIF